MSDTHDGVNEDRDNPVGCYCPGCGDFTPLEEAKHIRRGRGWCEDCFDPELF